MKATTKVEATRFQECFKRIQFGYHWQWRRGAGDDWVPSRGDWVMDGGTRPWEEGREGKFHPSLLRVRSQVGCWADGCKREFWPSEEAVSVGRVLSVCWLHIRFWILKFRCPGHNLRDSDSVGMSYFILFYFIFSSGTQPGILKQDTCTNCSTVGEISDSALAIK